MGTIPTTTLLPVRTLPQPGFSQTLESTISRFAEEVNFYYQLLSWSLFSCKEDQRNTIENLRTEVDRFRNFDLPALSENLNRLIRGATDAGVEKPGSFDSVVQVYHRFQHIDRAFSALKLQIQRRFHHFAHVNIW
ncbi:MAG: hypothetical protein IPJ82_08730 [Lewinellaceae bacterium]|nr:hypothetical protein [Lewinellaceae bacterium]